MIKKNLIILLLFSFGLTNFSPALAQEKVQIATIQKEKITNKAKKETRKESNSIEETLKSDNEKSSIFEKEPEPSYKAQLWMLRAVNFTIVLSIIATGLTIFGSALLSSEL